MASTGTRFPVTVLSGPLGAGKTTLVNRLLEDPGGRSLAIVVNDMGELNVDAGLIENADDGIVDLSNGCICCRLQDDLVDQLARLARERTFDHLVVEASGISEPQPIARTLTEGDVAETYRVDTMASVVDAYGFWKAFDPDASLPAGASSPPRPLSDIMVDQIEFCDVLLVNKCDLVPEAALDRIEASIRELQPRARILRTTHSDVDPETVLDTGRFDFEAIRSAQGWKRPLTDDHAHDGLGAAAEHGIESVVYEREAPFDPERLVAHLDTWRGDVLRAKGFLHVASRPETVIGLNQAGPSVRAGPIGEWDEQTPRTRLVVIGHELDRESLFTAFDDCLLETGAPPDGPPEQDPFPYERQPRS